MPSVCFCCRSFDAIVGPGLIGNVSAGADSFRLVLD